jgi:hypothetical protein
VEDSKLGMQKVRELCSEATVNITLKDSPCNLVAQAEIEMKLIVG